MHGTQGSERKDMNYKELKIMQDLIIELRFWGHYSGKHTGVCEYTDKVDEGCYLCEEIEKERRPITDAILKEAVDYVKVHDTIQ
jgi:hypothetical protein